MYFEILPIKYFVNNYIWKKNVLAGIMYGDVQTCKYD